MTAPEPAPSPAAGRPGAHCGHTSNCCGCPLCLRRWPTWRWVSCSPIRIFSRGRYSWRCGWRHRLCIWPGMVLNDVFDAELDARERPRRPIPSGRIARATAARLGFGLLGLGIAAGWIAGALAGGFKPGLIATALGRARFTLRWPAQADRAGAAGHGWLPDAQRSVGDECGRCGSAAARTGHRLAECRLAGGGRNRCLHCGRDLVCPHRSRHEPPRAIAGRHAGHAGRHRTGRLVSGADRSEAISPPAVDSVLAADLRDRWGAVRSGDPGPSGRDGATGGEELFAVAHRDRCGGRVGAGRHLLGVHDPAARCAGHAARALDFVDVSRTLRVIPRRAARRDRCETTQDRSAPTDPKSVDS